MSFCVDQAGMILAILHRLNSNPQPFFSYWDFRNTLPDHPFPFSISMAIIFLMAHLRHALRHILTSGLPPIPGVESKSQHIPGTAQGCCQGDTSLTLVFIPVEHSKSLHRGKH